MLIKIIKIINWSVIVLGFSVNLLLAQTLVFNKVEQMVILPPGQQYYEFSYTFINKGNKAVKINKVELSCGCSSYKMDKYIYAAGDSGAISIKIDTNGYAGQASVGAVMETDETDGLYKLQGFVIMPELIIVTPRMLRWQLGAEMKEKRFEVRLKEGVKNQTLNVKDVIVNQEYFYVRVEPVEEGSRYFVYVRPKQQVECASMIRVLTNPAGPEGGFSVVAYVGEKRDKL